MFVHSFLLENVFITLGSINDKEERIVKQGKYNLKEAIVDFQVLRKAEELMVSQ
jgi:hypothetical protein